jgi:hypothetical protein
MGDGFSSIFPWAVEFEMRVYCPYCDGVGGSIAAREMTAALHLTASLRLTTARLGKSRVERWEKVGNASRMKNAGEECHGILHFGK